MAGGGRVAFDSRRRHVSTLLEILALFTGKGRADVYVEWVSTLLEILGLVCLVVVGF